MKTIKKIPEKKYIKKEKLQKWVLELYSDYT